MKQTYQAYVIESNQDTYAGTVKSLQLDELPKRDVVVKVYYSSLNYKDALVSIGTKGIAKSYPHVPGIDACGIIVESQTDDFKVGDEVLVTGYEQGVAAPGGLADYITANKEWLIKLPSELSMKQAMVYGTAGLTAGLSVYKLMMSGVTPDSGDILVTGASGGVGSIAVSILGQLGYRVVAATGKIDQQERLLRLGASEVINRLEIIDESSRPLLKGRWAGVVDTVGGMILSTALKSCNYGAVVTACGNAMDHRFDITVYPFILKGITLHGIDSVYCPHSLREEIWNLLATAWQNPQLDTIVTEIKLNQVSPYLDQLSKGAVHGRIVVNMQH